MRLHRFVQVFVQMFRYILFFNDPATTEIYTLSHTTLFRSHRQPPPASDTSRSRSGRSGPDQWRSEEHTSELQSLRHLVCRLLLEKKKIKGNNDGITNSMMIIELQLQHERSNHSPRHTMLQD